MLFSDTVEDMLIKALDTGLSENEFWDMTLAEIVRYAESQNRRKQQEYKERAIFDYNLANLIGVSISRLYSKSNKYPSIQEAYPTLFNVEEDEEAKQNQITERSVTNFKKFAESFNKKFREVAKE